MPDNTPRDDEVLYRIALRRALASDDPARLTLHFDVAVLERYRGSPGISIIRTDTVGRVRKQGGWSLDFGIAPDEDMVHVTWSQLLTLPETEREHFAAHACLLPASKMFLQMRMTPGSCFDDGELRAWDADSAPNT
jgi:hypothetical protein